MNGLESAVFSSTSDPPPSPDRNIDIARKCHSDHIAQTFDFKDGGPSFQIRYWQDGKVPPEEVKRRAIAKLLDGEDSLDVSPPSND